MSFSAKETRSILALASLYNVRMLGLFMALPVLVLAGEEYGSNNTFLIGLALGIYGVTQALLQIPYGLLSDRFGRKPLIFIGLLVFIGGSLVAAMADTIYGLIIGRALQGAGAIAGVVMATVGDLTTEENRSKAMASIGVSIGVAFALALVFGPLLASIGGIRWVFGAAVGLSLLGLVLVVWVIPPVASSRKKSLSLRGMSSLLKDVGLLRLYFGIFILHGVLTALFMVFPVLLQKAGVATLNHSWIYLGVMFIAFVAMVPLMIWSERKQELKAVFLSMLALLIVVLLCLSLIQTNLWLLIAHMLLFFIGFNYLEATLPSLVSKQVPEDQRGAGSGIFSTCQFSGAAVGGIVGGAISGALGVQAIFLFAAAAILAWLVFAIGMDGQKPAKISTENVVA